MGRWHDLKSALNNMTAVHWLVATKVNIVEKKLLDPTNYIAPGFAFS